MPRAPSPGPPNRSPWDSRAVPWPPSTSPETAFSDPRAGDSGPARTSLRGVDYERLRQAKACWEPNNVFCRQKSIELPAPR
ncbi:BBE domain-containing protein [Salinactinospora qingdaonensis]|uniref:BBE domain-containing protein n=1 Tax=Salinactinospora qingdaonensis TaxID=702744 RepID=UPI003CD062D3